MCLPEGVQRAVVVLFGLGVEVHLQGLGHVLLVDHVDREADGLAGNGGLVQRQEERDALRGGCQKSAVSLARASLGGHGVKVHIY